MVVKAEPDTKAHVQVHYLVMELEEADVRHRGSEEGQKESISVLINIYQPALWKNSYNSDL